MNKELIERSAELERLLWKAIVEELSPQGQESLYLYQTLFLVRNMLGRMMRTAMGFDREGAARELEGLVASAQECVRGGEVGVVN